MTPDATKHSPPNPERRRFFKRLLHLAGLAAVFGTGFFWIARGRNPKSVPYGTRLGFGIVRPPGALVETDFLSACIRCTRCADACSTNAIALFGPEAGSLQGTPYIDPIGQACNMCLTCGAACPTTALEPLDEAVQVGMGTAVVDDRLCVSINGTGVCGACFTACPMRGKAITQGLRNAPTVHPEFCTGCGQCEQYCIVDDREGIRAIQIRTDRRWAHA